MKTLIKNTRVVSTDIDLPQTDILIDGGVIAEEGTPDDVFGNPKNERTQNFLKMVLQA